MGKKSRTLHESEFAKMEICVYWKLTNLPKLMQVYISVLLPILLVLQNVKQQFPLMVSLFFLIANEIIWAIVKYSLWDNFFKLKQSLHDAIATWKLNKSSESQTVNYMV